MTKDIFLVNKDCMVQKTTTESKYTSISEGAEFHTCAMLELVTESAHYKEDLGEHFKRYHM